MKQNEQAFLILKGLGYFHVDSEGQIWRHIKLMAGGRAGGKPQPIFLKAPEKADTSEAGPTSYRKVMFTFEAKRHAIYAHRIVWMTANARPIPEGMEINHKDGNKRNNHPANLELVTHSENTLHSFRELAQKSKPQRGSKNTSSKLTEEKVLLIRDLCAKKELTQGAIAAMFGVSQRTVSEIHLRKTWSHVG